ncbi:unnamed protein product [Amoebophrya sp. A120]|nr:unnamed protein product [Amoebophrya sp. A120]|eukprot:GSA120T00004299001.1
MSTPSDSLSVDLEGVLARVFVQARPTEKEKASLEEAAKVLDAGWIIDEDVVDTYTLNRGRGFNTVETFLCFVNWCKSERSGVERRETKRHAKETTGDEEDDHTTTISMHPPGKNNLAHTEKATSGSGPLCSVAKPASSAPCSGRLAASSTGAPKKRPKLDIDHESTSVSSRSTVGSSSPSSSSSYNDDYNLVHGIRKRPRRSESKCRDGTCVERVPSPSGRNKIRPQTKRKQVPSPAGPANSSCSCVEHTSSGGRFASASSQAVAPSGDHDAIEPVEPPAAASLECSVCLTRTVDRVLVPCGHTACGSCVDKLKDKRCHLCRKTFFQAIKLFLP